MNSFGSAGWLVNDRRREYSSQHGKADSCSAQWSGIPTLSMRANWLWSNDIPTTEPRRDETWATLLCSHPNGFMDYIIEDGSGLGSQGIAGIDNKLKCTNRNGKDIDIYIVHMYACECACNRKQFNSLWRLDYLPWSIWMWKSI